MCVSLGQGDFTWTHNGETVANSSFVTTYEEDFIQAGKMFRQSSLRICSVSSANAGTYTCLARNRTLLAMASTEITVPGKQFSTLYNIY